MGIRRALEGLLENQAQELRGATGSESRGSGPGSASLVTWSVGERPFAIVSSDGVELRLDEAVAAAARRTPDTEPSDRGPEWVRFNPRELDGHAVDRLEAWFGLAYRRVTE
jgi:hypothetical protein